MFQISNKNWRYFVLAAFFALIVYSGPIIDKNLPELSRNEIESIEKSYGIESIIKPGSPTYRLSNQLNSAKGDLYRLSFDVGANRRSDIYRGEEPDKKVGLNIAITGPVGKTKEIASIEIDPLDHGTQSKQLIFNTEDCYTDIIFSNVKTLDSAHITIRNVEITRLFSNDTIGLISGTPTIISAGNSHEGTTLIAKFNSKDQIIGRLIRFDKQYLTGLDLKLNFVNDGGGGNYKLFIKEADCIDTQCNLGNRDVANFYFNKKIADSIFRTNIPDNIYHLPIVAKLKVEKDYFIGISSEGVGVNLRSYLAVGGIGELPNNYKTTYLGKEINQFNIYFNIYSAIQTTHRATPLLVGSRIQGIDKTKSVYTYRIDRSHLTQFDVFQETESSVTYEFDFLYPVKSLYIDLSLDTTKQSEYSVLYSHDLKSWRPLQESSTYLETGSFKTQIAKDVNQKIYIMALGDNNKDGSNVELRFNKLNIDAELITNE